MLLKVWWKTKKNKNKMRNQWKRKEETTQKIQMSKQLGKSEKIYFISNRDAKSYNYRLYKQHRKTKHICVNFNMLTEM